ncbi:uncharacterized protein LOC126748970 [Anthonomus grandis grandis]|uniref:uncharacterized protein LOC126748970 n=1 Tax=Anthonomus grandis grandis TaxID=2921223 RepID=UPI00216627EE|nr:uncharacterized protein LOC126748970 [Anthonomus grandis grandis]XP_050314488.1 uncharacterized protein LOC126748970 [Anthonomus grandis grandis]
MDKDSASKRWVLVDEISCGEDAPLLNSSVSVSTDSDQESDGSISIISDFPTGNNSEEEHEPVDACKNQVLHDIEIDESPELNVHDEEGVVHQTTPNILISNNSDSTNTLTETCNIDTNRFEDVVDEETQANIMATSLETQTNPNLTLEKTSQTTDVAELRTQQYEGNQSSMIGYGLIASFLVIIFSSFFQQYTDYNQAGKQIHSNYKNFEPQNERENAILEFCVDKNKFKGDYFDTAVEKCIAKRLRRMEKEDGVKKTQVYLEIKEKLLDLREKELARKEKELEKALKGSEERIYKKKHTDLNKKLKEETKKKKKEVKRKEKEGKKRQEETTYKKWQQKKHKDFHSGNNTIIKSKHKRGKSNQTVDGQWYFQLYGNSRFDHRNRGKASEWYFKRANLRENKRNKARWYFEYMSNRDDSRVFYS